MQTFKQFIIEGGNAVTNVTRISKNNVAATLHNVNQQILSKVGLKWSVIGSAGIKDTSGDIDIAVNTQPGQIIDLDELLLKVKPLLPADCEVKTLKGINVLSFSFPIANELNNKLQVDLMITDNIDFAKFVYGRNRPTNLLMNKISTIVFPSNKVDKLDGVYETRFYFAPAAGLALGVKFYKKVKDKILAGKYISRKSLKDPNKIIMCLFGPHASMDTAASINTITAFLKSGQAMYMNVDLTSFPGLKTPFKYTKYSQDQIDEVESYISNELY